MDTGVHSSLVHSSEPKGSRTARKFGDRHRTIVARPRPRRGQYTDPVNPAAAKERLERLQSFRQQRARDLSISREIKHFVADVRRADRTMAALLTSWDRHAPERLRSACRPASLRGGVLVVSCDSSPAAYEVTRWVQEGGREKLSSSGLHVLRVRVVVGGRAEGEGGQARRRSAR